MSRSTPKNACTMCTVRFLFIMLTMGCTALVAAPLLGAQGIHNAVLDGDIAAVQQALDDGAAVDGYNLVGFAPLHSAARGGHIEIVRLLLDNGASPSIRTRTEDEDTPLHIATLNGREIVVGLLIAAGADINAQNAFGNAPIHEAATFGSPAIARALLDAGADSEIINPEDQTTSDANTADSTATNPEDQTTSDANTADSTATNPEDQTTSDANTADSADTNPEDQTTSDANTADSAATNPEDQTTSDANTADSAATNPEDQTASDTNTADSAATNPEDQTTSDANTADSTATNPEDQTTSDANKKAIKEVAIRDRRFFQFNVPLSLSYAATFSNLSTPSTTDVFALLHVDSAYQVLFNLENSTDYGMSLGPEIGISLSTSAALFFGTSSAAAGIPLLFFDDLWWLVTIPIAALSVVPIILFPGEFVDSVSVHIPVRLVYNIDFGGMDIDFLFGPQFNIGVPDTSLTVDIGVRLATWFGLFLDVIYALPFSVDVDSGAVYDGYWDNALRAGIGYRFWL